MHTETCLDGLQRPVRGWRFDCKRLVAFSSKTPKNHKEDRREAVLESRFNFDFEDETVFDAVILDASLDRLVTRTVSVKRLNLNSFEFQDYQTVSRSKTIFSIL